MAAYRRVYDSLTAKNRDQLRNPTLGNRVRATFTLFTQTFRDVNATPSIVYFSKQAVAFVRTGR